LACGQHSVFNRAARAQLMDKAIPLQIIPWNEVHLFCRKDAGLREGVAAVITQRQAQSSAAGQAKTLCAPGFRSAV
jgi:hypothetical protein